MNDEQLPGTKEAKALLVASSDYFFNGADEITHEFRTKSGWVMTVSAKVVQRPKEAKE